MEHRLALVIPGDGFAETCANTGCNRGLNQEGAQLLRKAGKYLVREVVQHIRMASTEAGSRGGRPLSGLIAAAKSKRGQSEAARPPFYSGVQRLHLTMRQS